MKIINDITELYLIFAHYLANNLEEIKGFQLRASSPPKADNELRLEWGEQKHFLAVTPLLYPSRKILDEFKQVEVKPSILLSPHIPSKLAEDYRKAGINHADLNGRLFIQVGGLLLDREPKEKRYNNPASEPDLFSPRTSRIIRAFLANRNTPWTQEDLVKRTKVSPGLVSRILKTLTDNNYILKLSDSNSRGGTPATYSLKDFDALLDAWKAADQWHKRVTIHQYSLLADDILEIAQTVHDALGDVNVAFTQWFAACLRHPYTTPPLVSAYVHKKLVDIFNARKVDSGGNLWLIVPNDEGVFYETQNVDGFNLVSDVQIYLDLLQVGQRGPDQAEELRKWDEFAR